MERGIVGNFLNAMREDNEFTIAAKGRFFVDKTGMIDILNGRIGTKERFICITRPRRFGKTVNAMMVASYYEKNLDMKDTFDKLNIAKCPSYKKHLNKHNVIYMSFNSGCDRHKTYDMHKTYFYDGLIEDIRKICPDVDTNAPINDVFNEAYTKLGEKFIFVIDEWNYIFQSRRYTKEDRRDFLIFLEDLLKDKPYVDLVYMTGITPISKNSSDCVLDMFCEYSAIKDDTFGKYFGFLEEEVERICAKQNKLTMDNLKGWYDGYRTFCGDIIYNPRSVVSALRRGVCQDYWVKTGRLKEIATYVNKNVEGLKKDVIAMLAGEKLQINLREFSDDSIDTKDSVFLDMVVLGFLSYYTTKENIELAKMTGGEPEKYLKIPNKELMLEFERLITSGDIRGLEEVTSDSRDMLMATIDKNTDKMEALLEKTHNAYDSYFEHNTENPLACIITILYLEARVKYATKRRDIEKTEGVEFLFFPLYLRSTAFMIELKKDDTPENAIEQIKTSENFILFKSFPGRKLLVGIAYDTKNKKHSVKIEEL